MWFYFLVLCYFHCPEPNTKLETNFWHDEFKIETSDVSGRTKPFIPYSSSDTFKRLVLGAISKMATIISHLEQHVWTRWGWQDSVSSKTLTFVRKCLLLTLECCRTPFPLRPTANLTIFVDIRYLARGIVIWISQMSNSSPGLHMVWSSSHCKWSCSCYAKQGLNDSAVCVASCHLLVQWQLLTLPCGLVIVNNNNSKSLHNRVFWHTDGSLLLWAIHHRATCQPPAVALRPLGETNLNALISIKMFSLVSWPFAQFTGAARLHPWSVLLGNLLLILGPYQDCAHVGFKQNDGLYFAWICFACLMLFQTTQPIVCFDQSDMAGISCIWLMIYAWFSVGFSVFATVSVNIVCLGTHLRLIQGRHLILEEKVIHVPFYPFCIEILLNRQTEVHSPKVTFETTVNRLLVRIVTVAE